MSSQPLDEELYEQVKAEAKQRFAVWPSAYASGWLVREYKRRGGRYIGDEMDGQPTGLTKWFGEEWVDISRPIYDKHGELVGYEPCGRKHSSQVNYPKCRPVAEAMRMTPSEIKSAISRKRAAESRVTPRKGRSPVMVPTYENPGSPGSVYEQLVRLYARGNPGVHGPIRTNPMKRVSEDTRLYVVGPYAEYLSRKEPRAECHALFLVDSDRLVGGMELVKSGQSMFVKASAAMEGWGPLLYLAGFTWAFLNDANVVVSDTVVSQDARNLWSKFVTTGVAKPAPQGVKGFFTARPDLYLPETVSISRFSFQDYMRHGPRAKDDTNDAWFPLTGGILGEGYAPLWPSALVEPAVRRKREADRQVASSIDSEPVRVPTYVNPTTVVECGCGWSWEVEYDDPDPLLCHKCWGQYGVELVRR